MITEEKLREIGARGNAQILRILKEAKIRMSNPQYRKKYNLLPKEEIELLEFLER